MTEFKILDFSILDKLTPAQKVWIAENMKRDDEERKKILEV